MLCDAGTRGVRRAVADCGSGPVGMHKTSLTSPFRASVFALLAFAAGLAGGGQGCSEPDDPCEGGVCRCEDVSQCAFDCGHTPCDVSCASADSCDLTCGDECTAGCTSVSDCATSCGDDCKFSCRSLETCEVECGEGCDYSCVHASTCNAQVGPDSSVTCDSTPVCRVVCEGACEVSCAGVQSCLVTCAEGAPMSCPDGRMVCAPGTCLG